MNGIFFYFKAENVKLVKNFLHLLLSITTEKHSFFIPLELGYNEHGYNVFADITIELNL